MKEPSNLEKVAGGLPVRLATAGIAAFDGGILASFFPVLTSSLPAKRHEKRVRSYLADIENILKEHEAKINKLTDEQYKLINHAALSALTTIEDKKLEYLKRIIRNTLKDADIRSLESEVIGRWLRDISADEILFIIENFHFDRIEIVDKPSNKKHKSVTDDSREASTTAGLVSLGILIPSGPNLDTLGTYSFSNLVSKLIALLIKKP